MKQMKKKFKRLQEKSTEAFPITRLNWFFYTFEFFKKYELIGKDWLSLDEALKRVIKHFGYKENTIPPNMINICDYASFNIMMMWNWNIYKQIYRFDEDFFEYISDNAEYKSTINVENYLHKLPCSAFFIDNKFEDKKGHKYRGCFVCVDRDTNDLRLAFVEQGGDSDCQWSNVPLFLGNGTIEDLLKRKDKDYKIHPIILELTQRICRCLDYLCADNKQIEYRKAKDKKEEYNLNRQRKENVVLNDVGVRIGNTIRQNRVVYERDKDAVHHTGSHKSPHLRSAHYHSFWTGKKDGSEERKLIVKFIEPIFVGQGKEITPTVHKVVK